MLSPLGIALPSPAPLIDGRVLAMVYVAVLACNGLFVWFLLEVHRAIPLAARRIPTWLLYLMIIPDCAIFISWLVVPLRLPESLRLAYRTLGIELQHDGGARLGLLWLGLLWAGLICGLLQQGLPALLCLGLCLVFLLRWCRLLLLMKRHLQRIAREIQAREAERST